MNKIGFNQSEASWISLGLAVVLLVMLVPGCCCLKFFLEKRNMTNQTIAEEVFKQLKKEDADGLKKHLVPKACLDCGIDMATAFSTLRQDPHGL